jgi:uncharacterized protein YxjI
MPVTAVCECGKNYTLKDEFAGKSIKCPSCGSAFVAPAIERMAQADPVFDRDKFLIRQKKIALSAKYFVGDEQGREIAFVHRPLAFAQSLLMIFLIFLCVGLIVIGIALLSAAGHEASLLLLPILIIPGVWGIAYKFAPYRHVTFYRDPTMRDKLMTVRQDVRFAPINFRYTLLDAAGEPLVRFRKNVLYNMIRKRWYVEDLDGGLFCLALEESILLSLLRRFLGPMLGLLRTNFIITTDDGLHMLGEFNRKLTLFDKYVLDLTHDPERTLDRRIALALGVMLDTGENR